MAKLIINVQKYLPSLTESMADPPKNLLRSVQPTCRVSGVAGISKRTADDLGCWVGGNRRRGIKRAVYWFKKERW